MKIDLNNPAAIAAVKTVRELHGIGEDQWKKLEHTLEKEYKCKVIYEDAYGLSGYMEMPDDKYTTWFLVQFGGTL